ncbi:relaxase domain-containing protein [Streptomyces sp. 2231.1]|uniref:relaxase domain-containing protein n=1 Tax=Streptomyces sp. 2231.1 TaxID=1855347 RepID=UPI00210BB9EE|nr:relaxase domain-containing protein [Streptomyces sp. 2231.1]
MTPGLRPVMEIAGVDSALIDWSSTRRQRIEDVLEGLTYKYVQEYGRLPGERARHSLGWQAAQDTRPEKKTPRPLKQLLAWWRASALLQFGKQMVDGLVQRCRAAGAAIRARVDPHVDAVLAAVDVAAVVSTVRGKFARRHVPAEDCRHLLETLRGQEFTRGLDDCIAGRALSDHSRQSTVPKPGRRAPDTDQLLYTADFAGPDRWWIAGTDGKPPRESSRYERARVASLAVQNAIRASRPAPADDHHRDQASDTPHAVDQPGPRGSPYPGAAGSCQPGPPAGRDAAGVCGRPDDRPGYVDAHTGEPGAARRLHPRGQRPPPRYRRPAEARAAGRRGQARRPAAAPREPTRPGQGSGP